MTLILKPEKDSIKKKKKEKQGKRKLQPTSLNIDTEVLSQMLLNRIQQYIKIIIYHDQPRVQGSVNIQKPVHVIDRINSLREILPHLLKVLCFTFHSVLHCELTFVCIQSLGGD